MPVKTREKTKKGDNVGLGRRRRAQDDSWAAGAWGTEALRRDDSIPDGLEGGGLCFWQRTGG